MRYSRALAFLLVLAIAAFLSGCGGSQSVSPNVLATTVATDAPAGSTVSVEFGEQNSSYPLQTSSYPAPSGGGTVNVIVAGMRPQTTYNMRTKTVLADGTVSTGPDTTFTTGTLDPSRFPQFTTSGDTNSGRGIELINLTGLSTEDFGDNVQVMATDLSGNIIWYYDHPISEGLVLAIQPIPNGDFLLNISDYVSKSTVREIDLAGNTVREVSLDSINQSLASAGYNYSVKFLHHDIRLLPNGHVLVLGAVDKIMSGLIGQSDNTTVEGDAVLDLDKNFNLAWAWSTFDHLDVNRHPLAFPPDWTHANAIVYTADHNLLLSLRNQSWLLKIDYQDGAGTGNVLWRLGPGGDFALTNGTQFDWFYAQHFPNILSESNGHMTLAVWDNGNGRPDSNGAPCTTDCYSRPVIFDVDQQNLTASIVWQHLPGLFTPWGGDVIQLGNGNIEYDLPAPTSLSGSRIQEVTFTSDPQVIWQMDLSVPTAYRAYRIPSLYPGVQW